MLGSGVNIRQSGAEKQQLNFLGLIKRASTGQHENLVYTHTDETL